MSFIEVEFLEMSFSKISNYVNNLESIAIDKETVDKYCDCFYRAAFSISLNIDDYIANHCYLAVPGLLLNIKEGLFFSKEQSIEECINNTKGKLLELSSKSKEVYERVSDIFNKGSFYNYYSVKLLRDIASSNVENLLIV